MSQIRWWQFGRTATIHHVFLIKLLLWQTSCSSIWAFTVVAQPVMDGQTGWLASWLVDSRMVAMWQWIFYWAPFVDYHSSLFYTEGHIYGSDTNTHTHIHTWSISPFSSSVSGPFNLHTYIFTYFPFHQYTHTNIFTRILVGVLWLYVYLQLTIRVPAWASFMR